MSAFIVDKAHLDLIVTAALHGASDSESDWHPISWRRTDDESGELEFVEMSAAQADWVGAVLAGTNVDSVCHRYEDASDLLLDYVLHGYRYEDRGYRPTGIEVLKAIGCYEYQSCEHDEWEESEAARFCAALRAAIVSRLPGYDAAPYEWTDDRMAERGVRRDPATLPTGELVRFSYNGHLRLVRPLRMRETNRGRVLMALELEKDGVAHDEPMPKCFSPERIDGLSYPLAA